MERVEEYLEAILDIQGKDRKVVKTSEVARRLNVKPSSVTEMFTKLKEMGYVEYIPYRGVVLTEKGKRVAEKIKRYYEIFVRLFRFLGVEDEKAKKLSCELEHHADEKVIERICTLISGVCDLCEECRYVELPLSKAERGIYEVLIAPESLKGLIEVGKTIEVLENDEILKVKVNDEVFEVSKDVGRKVLVKPSSSS